MEEPKCAPASLHPNVPSMAIEPTPVFHVPRGDVAVLAHV